MNARLAAAVGALAALSATILSVLGPMAPANAGVLFSINDEAGFHTAMAGNTSLGTEDFEEFIGSPNNIFFGFFPLTQGVAQGGYPTGLTLPITLQGNTAGGTPTQPNLLPGGRTLLAHASAGALGGVSSDAVFAFEAFDEDSSLDIILAASDGILGVGFDVLADMAVSNMEVRVYDINNVFLGLQTIAADLGGSNFLGVQATAGTRIGRINLFAPQGRNEGVDNIQLFAAAVTVPEPGTAALFGIGLTGLGFLARRRKGRLDPDSPSQTVSAPSR